MDKNEPALIIKRTPEFFEAAKAECGGFSHGIKVGIKIKEADLTMPRGVRGLLS